MAKYGISIKIDVKKLDKTKFFHAKSGAIYVDLTTFVDVDTKGQHGDNGIISQSLSKEDKAAGVKMPIIGNSTVFWRDDSPPQQTQGPTQYNQQPPQDDLDSDIPF